MTLVGPDGTVYSSDSPGVTSSTTPTSESLDVSNPAPGSWSVKLFGDDVKDGGEPTSVTAYADVPAPSELNVQISSSAALDDPHTYTVIAAGPQGADYRWTFSDGQTADGPSVTHTFSADGDLRATVEASDSSGVEGWSSADLGWVGPPGNTTAPTVTGTPVEGQTLSVVHGSWQGSPSQVSDQWQRCDNTGAGCVDIDGATSQSYVLTAADVGQTVRVEESATNGAGSSPPTSSQPTAEILPKRPSVVTAPSVSGTAAVGQTLSERHGTWSNDPTSYRYQWEDCDSSGANCTPIFGAIDQAYTLIGYDAGHTIRVQETATNGGGDSSPATSDATSVVVPLPPSNLAPPSITGDARDGRILVEAHGSWTNSPTSYSYQWERCDSNGTNCQPISGANSDSYVLSSDDVGSMLVVQETASNAGGAGRPATSSASAVVQAAGIPVASAPPTVSGTAHQDQTLSESHGTWSNTPSLYAYQWQDCDVAGANCLAIAGATQQTYTLTAADVGHTIIVQEIASTVSGSGLPASSSPSAVVMPLPPSSTAPPSVSGATTAGQTLTESHGSWSNNPTSYSYQWEDCDNAGGSCTAIAGATGHSYTLTSGDVGHTIRVREAASNAGGDSNPASSTATGVVQPAAAPPTRPSNNSPPAVVGETTVGQTLSVSTGTWSGTPPISYAYQWQRCTPGCADVPGATDSTLKLASSDLGARVRVVVSASNTAGTATVSSSSVGPVSTAGPAPGKIKAALTAALRAPSHGATVTSILKHGGYTVSFIAPSAGRLLIAWYFLPPGAHLPLVGHRASSKNKAKPMLVASVSMTYRQARKAQARITLTGEGRQLLRHAPHVKLVAASSFTPTGGPTTTIQTTINVRR